MFIINRKRYLHGILFINVTITSSQSKSGAGVVVKFNYWVGNCQRNSCAKKISKYQNKHIKVMTKKLLASFLWTQCTCCTYVHYALPTRPWMHILPAHDVSRGLLRRTLIELAMATRQTRISVKLGINFAFYVVARWHKSPALALATLTSNCICALRQV